MEKEGRIRGETSREEKGGGVGQREEMRKEGGRS